MTTVVSADATNGQLKLAQASPAQLGTPNQEASTFTGDWRINTNTNASFTLTLIQDGDNVTGQYVTTSGDKGRIEGRVQGPVMIFQWSQVSGFKGAGRFDLASDGSSFMGQFRADPHPSIPAGFLQGVWNGTRASMGQPQMGQPQMGQPPMGQPPMGQSPVGQAPVDQAPVQPGNISDLSCEQLWIRRNSAFKEAGYCFKTQRAIRQFGNAGCQHDDENSVPLSQQSRDLVAAIRRVENSRQCPR